MKIYRSSVARFLATMSLVIFLFPVSAEAGLRNFFSGRRYQNRRVVQRRTVQPTIVAPIQATPDVPNASGPPAPVIKSSEPETTGQTLIPNAAAQRSIQARIAAAIANDNVVRPDVQRSVLGQPSQVLSPSIQFILTGSPTNFNLTAPTTPTPTSSPRPFSLISIGRGPAVKAYEEGTPQFQLIRRGPQVRALQEDVPPPPNAPDATDFVLADDGPVPEPEDPKYTPPKLEIGGADAPIPLGELVQLWVKTPDKFPENLSSTAYTWTILPRKNVVVWPDKTRILFGAGTKNSTFIVIITASHVFIEKDADGKITKIIQRAVNKMVQVQVGDGTVIPDPGGNDNGNTPPSLSGLSKQAYDWIINVQVTNTYTVAMRKADAAKLATSFAAIAGKIQDGTLRDVTAILQATKTSNDAAITTRDQWLPWFTKMSEHLQKSYNDGTIKTLQQFNTAWLQIAAGITAASK